MKQLLTFMADSPEKKGHAWFECACGIQIHVRKNSVSPKGRLSCGCQTKDGRDMKSKKDKDLYNIWSVHYREAFPEYPLFVAELGVKPFEGATVTTLNKDNPASPGNIGWGKPIYSHTEDRLPPKLFMPLDPKQFNQYNQDAYKEEIEETSHIFSLRRLTETYDAIREKFIDDPVEMERAIEALSTTESVDSFDRSEAKLMKSGKASMASTWQQFRAQVLPLIVERMRTIHNSAMNKQSGIHHSTIRPILSTGLITPEEIALIGLNTCLDSLGDGTGYKRPLLKVFKDIGRRIDDQCFLRWYEENMPSEFGYVKKFFLDSNAGYYKKMRKTVTWLGAKNLIPEHSYKRLSSIKDSSGKKFGVEPLVHLGEWVFQAIQSSTIWFNAELMWQSDGKGKHKAYYFGLSEEGVRWKDLIQQGIKELLFEAQPMVCDPIPWPEEFHKHNHAGYISPQPLNFSKLIHGHKGTKPSPEAIQALNKVQAVAWKINPFMFHTLSACLGKNIQIGEKFICHDRESFLDQHIPSIDPAVWNLPKKDPEYKKAKSKISRAYSQCISNEQLEHNAFRALKTAAKFLNFEAIHFPCYFDNRLRIYYLHTSGLHPQGANFAKSLLLFADPLQVTEENREAVETDLLVTIANCYGNDKISFNDRVKFARSILPAFENVAKEPLAHGHLKMWDELAEPFTFLASLRQYFEVFVWRTRDTVDVPCGRDATSSGLQLMSALMREEKAMRFTNVIPSDKPQDLYGEVARHAKGLLNNDVWLQNEMDKRLKNATQRLEKAGKEVNPENFTFNLDPEKIARGHTKKAVMTDSYNASWRSKNEYISDELEKLEKDLGRKVTLSEKATVTSAIISGQNQAFPVCKVIKDFMKAVVVNIIGHQGKNIIRWETPCGSEITQRYNKSKAEQIQTYAMGGGQLYKSKAPNKDADGSILLSWQREIDEIDKSGHGLGLSPNFHHALDAYICQQSILHCGTDVIASAHDCFYMRPGDVQTAVKGVKDSFLKLVTSDVLQRLLDLNEVEGMLVPRFGGDELLKDFDKSNYCFH